MREIEWESCLVEAVRNPDLEQRFSQATGRPGRLIAFLSGSPWIEEAVIRFTVQMGTQLQISPDLIDQVGLVVSQDNSCRFCFGAQRAFLRVMGMSEAKISRLEQDLFTADTNPKEKVALEIARRVSRSNPLIRAADIEGLRKQGFSDSEIVELLSQIALHLFFNRLSTLTALSPDMSENLPDHFWFRAVRPLMAIFVRRTRKKGEPVALESAERQGPYSAWINAFDGLPVAKDLRLVMDQMWASSSISPRAVPLVFAVVSRALGCEASEREARRLLLECDLTSDEIDEILTHLTSPALSDLERLIVPLARETVWYQPAQIQRRCREVQAHLDREQFIDFLGATSLANAICRIGVITGDCEVAE